MQLGLSFSEPVEPAARIEPCFVRHHRARRYVLRVDANGRGRVTIPRGGSRREASAFAERHAEWIGRQRSRLTTQAPSFDEGRTLREPPRPELPAPLRDVAGRLAVACW